MTTKNIGHCFRISPDDRLIFGGRARFASSSEQSDARRGHVLAGNLREIFPQIADAEIDYCWGGMLDMTMGRLPRAGEKDGLYYSVGYSGHGVQMSVHMGLVMAGDVGANPWHDLDWPAVPGHFGKPLFFPMAGAWYRFLDLVRGCLNSLPCHEVQLLPLRRAIP